MRVHHALRVAGGARGEEHRRHVVQAWPLATSASKKPACAASCARPASISASSDARPRLVVVAQAARVVVPDARELRALRAQLEQLVDLLLVFDDREAHLGVVDREHELGGRRVLVQRHRNRAQRLRRQHRRVQARPVLAHHHQVLAALQARLGQAAGEVAHQRASCAQVMRLPDAVVPSRAAPARRAAACAWSSIRRGKVVCTDSAPGQAVAGRPRC